MVTLKIPYVWQRGTSWQYQRQVPPDVRASIGKSKWYHTWPARTDADKVMIEAKALARRHDAEIALARGQIKAAEIAEAEQQARDFLKRPPVERHESLSFLYDNPSPLSELFLAAVEAGGTVPRQGITLSEAVARHSVGLDGKPFRFALKSWKAVHSDMDVTKITRQDVRLWLDHERQRGLKPSTVRRRLDALRAAVNRAHLDADHAGRNPFEQHRIVGGQGSPSDRVPFHRSHLDLITSYLFNTPRLRPDTRNLLRLLMLTGAGTAEIAGAEVADVILDHETPRLWIRPNSIRTLKTSARDRQVPLIGDALDAAKDAVARAAGPNLFEGYGRGGRGAEYFSARLNQALRRAGIPQTRRLSVYSFRHTWAEALRAADVQEDLRRRILGHSGRDIHSRYGADRAERVAARDAMVRALPLLGDIDESVYRPDELSLRGG